MTGPRLLVIDDEAEFCEYVRKVAADMGFDAEAATRPQDFIDAYNRAAPDAIVLDIVMPEVDGIELLNWLVDQGYAGEVIVVTGYNPRYADLTKMIGEAKGMTINTMTKPVNLSDLRAALSRHVPAMAVAAGEHP